MTATIEKSNNAQLFKSSLQTELAVDERIAAMATTILERYRARNPLFVCLLRGGAPFAAKLMFAIAKQDPKFHPEMDYLTVRSYGDERHTEQSQLVMGLAPGTQIKGRAVILLDDVLDKGHTAVFATNYALKAGAASADLVVLVQKQQDRPAFPNAALFGFEAPADWLTGMGMDDARLAKEGNRWMGNLAIANDA